MEADGFGVSAWLRSIGGVLFFVAGVLTWWELEYGEGLSTPFNGFDYRLTGVVPYIIFVGIAILTIIIETESLALPRFLVNPVLMLIAAVTGTALVGARFFKDGYDNADLAAQGNTINRGIGLYLAVAAALIVLAGCVLACRDAWLRRDEDADDVEPEPDWSERAHRRSSPPLP